ncbi:MAG: hypothetical protein AABM31_06505 [Actinomycetota bacterium]
MSTAAQDTGTAGPAHVATVSFLASRAVPSGGFWVALAGGTALARVAQRRGAREGYGASWAAMLETVAIMGPARFGVPLTQALSAPLMGRLEARGRGALAQFLACAAIRVLSNAVGVAFFVFVIAGGLDAYAGSYENLAGLFGLEVGERGTVIVTLAGLFAWGAFASVVQVTVYRRALRSWPSVPEADETASPEPEPPHSGRFDPRVIAVAAAVSFALLLASTEWIVLAAVTAFLAVAWVVSRPDRRAVPTGLALAGVLAVGALVFSLGAGLGVEVALRRASRAALLVLAATWLRAAAGADGLREVSRRALGRLRAFPSAREAAQVLDTIGSEGRLASAGRALLGAIDGVPNRPAPFVDAVLGWVAREAAHYRAPERAPALALRARLVDALLLVAAVAPAAALFA